MAAASGKQQSAVVRNILDLNIDAIFNPIVPPNRLDLLPKPISRFLGYRESEQKEPAPLFRLPLIFLATVAGLCLVGGTFNNAPGIKKWHPPSLVASLGATAILDYNAIASPLSQPRNAIFGHTLSAVVGVAISKLFQLNSDFDNIQWVSGAVGCGCASIVMTVTGTIHPPGGATAVLASADAEVLALGWIFPPLILLASTLMTIVALIFNNTVRRYPTYWWTPQPVGQLIPIPSAPKPGEKDNQKSSKDVEKNASPEPESEPVPDEKAGGREESSAHSHSSGSQRLPLLAQIPSEMELTSSEKLLLERIDRRIQDCNPKSNGRS